MSKIPKAGDRIRLIAMPDDPDPIPTGSVGIVIAVSSHGDGKDGWHQVDVDWDHGRNLMLTLPPDQIEILPSRDMEKGGGFSCHMRRNATR
jgi:hypothetical protein